MKMSEDKVVYQSVSAKENIEDFIPQICEPPKGFGARHTQVLILFVCLTIAFSLRANLSIAMVAMTSSDFIEDTSCVIVKDYDDINNTRTSFNISHTKSEQNNTNVKNRGKHCGNTEASSSYWNVYRTYPWHKGTQEMILFSFFVGYTCMMIPMGMAAQKYGGKKPILLALLVNGIVSILTPWVPIFAGWLGVCICRLLQGMTQAACFPSIHTILGKWAPLGERGRLSTYIYTGSQFGTVLIFQISGLFAGIPSLGWPSIFWLCGVSSLMCFGLFAWLGAATPQDHPTITSEELMYIMGDGSADLGSKERRIPWKHMLTSTAVWGLVVSHAGSAVGYLLVLTQTPTYMSKVLGVDIKRNGLYSSLPYIAMYFVTLGFGYLSDLFVRRKIMSVKNIRRTANSIGMVLAGLFLIAFGYVKNTTAAVILLILTLSAHSGVHVGFHINQIDLAPNFAGAIMALGNMIANLTSLLVPVMVSNVVQDDLTNRQRWQTVFIITAVFKIITNAVFVVFVKGTVQPWNFNDDDETFNASEGEYVLKEKNKLSAVIEKPGDEKA